MNPSIQASFLDELEKIALDPLLSPAIGAYYAGPKDRARGAGYGFVGGNIGGAVGAMGGAAGGSILGAIAETLARKRGWEALGTLGGALVGGIGGTYVGGKRGGQMAKRDGEAVRKAKKWRKRKD